MLSEQERQIAEFGKQNGKSRDEVVAAISKFRQSQATTTTPAQTAVTEAPKKPLANKVTDFLGLGGATDVFGRILARQGIGTETPKEVTQEFVEKPTTGQVAGALAQTGATVAGSAIAGPASLAGKVAVGAGLGYLYDIGADLVEQKSITETATPGAGTLVGAFAPVVLKGAGMAVGAAAKPVEKALGRASQAVTTTIPESNIVKGGKQIATEVAERIPRAVSRGSQAIDEAAQRAEKIKVAPPPVKEALKVGLDEVLDVDVIAQADEPTKTALRQMVNLAETPRAGLRPRTQPSSIAGEAAAQQFDLVEKQRKLIGNQIGEISDRLSAKEQIDAVPLQRNVRDVLRQNNILPDASGKLVFRTKKLTPSQQNVVQRLYEMSTADEKLTPRQLHEYDQLFSKLQREARFQDQIDDVYLSVQTPEGPTEVNIFKVFRDMYSQKLDEVAPEIRPLNREYRTLRNLKDDLEDSIFKSGSFETTGNVNASNYAQTNLRRLFSNAQSAADYRAIYENLDEVSRQLGYEGARADDLAGFALQLQKLYPDTVQETSFDGSIIGSIKAVLDTGKANTADQRKALKILLEMQDAQPSLQAK